MCFEVSFVNIKIKTFFYNSKISFLPDLSKCLKLEYFGFYCINSTELICDFRKINLFGYRAMSINIFLGKDTNHITNTGRYNDFIGRETKDIRELLEEFREDLYDDCIIEQAIKKNNEEREEDERINKIHQSIKEREYENKIEQLENKLEETRDELGNKIEKLQQNVADLFKIIEELKHPKSFYM